MKAETKRIYEASPRHCEPITAQNPGVKCPKWSAAVAQELLDYGLSRRQKITGYAGWSRIRGDENSHFGRHGDLAWISRGMG